MKKKLFLSLAIFSLVFVTSCTINPFRLSSDSSYQDNGTNTYNSNLNLSNSTSAFLKGKSYYTDMKRASEYAAPSLGEVKMLIVPVCFFDETNYLNYYGGSQAVKDNLEMTFFNENNPYWYSVSEYYSLSSYGNINITGTVSDIYVTKHPFSYYSSISSTSEGEASSIIAREISSNARSLGIDISNYDSDNDGIVDYFWMVNLHPIDSSKSFQWAYTFYDSEYYSSHIYNYSWASYEFLIREEGFNTYYDDAHTFIHETGHQMGIVDYYSYDDVNYPRSPIGGVDMMDSNVVDHSSLTKYNLGWVDPIIGEVGKSYTLNKFESSGDCLILASNFNGTCFDEYFILEYYTPTGLNQLDSQSQYKGYYPQGFTINGLKVTHVDQRLGKMEYQLQGNVAVSYSWDNKFYDLVDAHIPTVGEPYYYDFVSSNTKKYCLGPTRWALCNLVQASGKNNLMQESNSIYNQYQHSAQNSDLFTKDSLVFGKDVLNGYITNEGWKISTSIKITSQDDNSISFTLEELTY